MEHVWKTNILPIMYYEDVPHHVPYTFNQTGLANIMVIDEDSLFQILVDTKDKINISEKNASSRNYIEFALKIHDDRNKNEVIEKNWVSEDSLDLNSAIYNTYQQMIELYNAMTK